MKTSKHAVYRALLEAGDKGVAEGEVNLGVARRVAFSTNAHIEEFQPRSGGSKRYRLVKHPDVSPLVQAALKLHEEEVSEEGLIWPQPPSEEFQNLLRLAVKAALDAGVGRAEVLFSLSRTVNDVAHLMVIEESRQPKIEIED